MIGLALTTLVAMALRPYFDLINIVMLFLLSVFLISLKLGRGAAVMSAILAVALFDFFFVPPTLTFVVNDAQYIVTFAIMLAVGLVTAHLTTTLKKQTDQAVSREIDTQRLYLLASQLAGTSSLLALENALQTYLSEMHYSANIHLLNASNELPSLTNNISISSLAYAAIKNGSFVDLTQLADNGLHQYIVPLKSSNRMMGIMLVNEITHDAYAKSTVSKNLLGAIANLVSIALERLHYVDIAQEKNLEVSSERLRSSILSALSHDLRTPLTGLVGMADALALSSEVANEKIKKSASSIRDQARAMSNMFNNLLDMAKLHAGSVNLRKEWQLFEEVIGASINLMKPALAKHPIKTFLAPDLPLVEFDAVLLERVICNLLENAAKYSPEGTPIEVHAYIENECACISIKDHGAGFLTTQTHQAFKMFSRGNPESTLPGVGLGLAICQAIVEAHDAKMVAENNKSGGASVTLYLPLGVSPKVILESE